MDPISRKVIALIASHDTNTALRSWAEAEGFDLGSDYDGNPRPPDKFDFHVTLVASKNEVFVPETQHLIRPLGLEAVGFDELGVDRRVPVITLQPSAGLSTMRAFFVETYGIEPTFDDFKPHVSVSYAWHGKPALEVLDVPDVPLVFDQLCVKPLPATPTAKSLDWSAIGRELAILQGMIS